MTFGEKLSKQRKENNYTQEQLADVLGVSRQAISKWESNITYPETDKLIRISELFNCSLDYLLKDTEETDTSKQTNEETSFFRKRLRERKSEKTDTVKGSQDGFIELSPDGKIVQGLSLSDILNVLDGLYTAEGTICFFTTNHIEKLDSAFLRDGRMDCKIEMDDLTKEVANKMIQDKLGYNGLFTRDSINPATLQELIIQVMWKKLSIEDFINIINGKES